MVIGSFLPLFERLRVLRLSNIRALGSGSAAVITGLHALAAAGPTSIETLVMDCTLRSGSFLDNQKFLDACNSGERVQVRPKSTDAKNDDENSLENRTSHNLIPTFCSFIRASPSMSNFRATEARMGDLGFSMVSSALFDSANAVKSLHVGGNNLTPNSMSVLTTLLGTVSLKEYITGGALACGLVELSVSNNDIGNDGACILLPALTLYCPKLAVLEVDGNSLGKRAFQSILDHTIPSLRSLNMGDNVDYDNIDPEEEGDKEKLAAMILERYNDIQADGVEFELITDYDEDDLDFE